MIYRIRTYPQNRGFLACKKLLFFVNVLKKEISHLQDLLCGIGSNLSKKNNLSRLKWVNKYYST